MILAHVDGKKTDRKALNLIPIPARTNVSERWQGVGHGKLATAIVKRVEAAGLQVAREEWYVNPKRDTMWGSVDITPESMCNVNKGVTLDIGQQANFSLGLRHSNGGRYAVSFAVGA